MARTSIFTDHAPKAIGPYSQAVRAGNTVYLSGQIPLDPRTGELVSGDIKLEKLGVRTVEDLLFHLPRQYEDRTRITPIGALRPGWTVSVEGTVELTEVAFRGRRMLLTRISDGTGALTLRFFHFNATQQAM